MLSAFDFYVKSYKWMVLPVWPDSKHPAIEDWTDPNRYSTEQLRSYFEDNPDYNMAILLGEIIDVESDSESGNKFLDKMIGDYKHPKYKSQKSTHHLFLNPDGIRHKTFQQKIEFRGYGCQSLLPPSKVNNVRYEWCPDSVSKIPSLPPSLRRFYWHCSNTKNKKRYWCCDCGKECLDSLLKVEKSLKNNKKLRCKDCKNKIYINA